MQPDRPYRRGIRLAHERGPERRPGTTAADPKRPTQLRVRRRIPLVLSPPRAKLEPEPAVVDSLRGGGYCRELSMKPIPDDVQEFVVPPNVAAIRVEVTSRGPGTSSHSVVAVQARPGDVLRIAFTCIPGPAR